MHPELEDRVTEDPKPDADAIGRRAQGQAMSEVREYRGLRQIDVAEAFGVSRRTVQNWESGKVRPDAQALRAFADLTKSDEVALIVAGLLDRPKLGVRCADNKLMRTLLVSVHAFDSNFGDAIKDIRTNVALAAFDDAFAALATEASRGRTIDEQAAKLSFRRPREEEDDNG